MEKRVEESLEDKLKRLKAYDDFLLPQRRDLSFSGEYRFCDGCNILTDGGRDCDNCHYCYCSECASTMHTHENTARCKRCMLTCIVPGCNVTGSDCCFLRCCFCFKRVCKNHPHRKNGTKGSLYFVRGKRFQIKEFFISITLTPCPRQNTPKLSCRPARCPCSFPGNRACTEGPFPAYGHSSEIPHHSPGDHRVLRAVHLTSAQCRSHLAQPSGVCPSLEPVASRAQCPRLKSDMCSFFFKPQKTLLSF